MLKYKPGWDTLATSSLDLAAIMDKVHGLKLVEVRTVHFKLRENSFSERKTCFLKHLLVAGSE